MIKLSEIEINNFRIFPAGTYSKIRVSDISIITGANSSGKSSLFKALLLLQDNWQKNHLTQLDFTDRQHKLGSIKSVLNDASKPLKIKLSFDDDIALEYEFGNNEKGELLSFSFSKKQHSIFKIAKNKKGFYKVLELDIIWFEFEIEQVIKPKEENLIWETQIKEYINSEYDLQELEIQLQAKISNAEEEQKIEDKKQKEIERIEQETELSEEEKQKVQDTIENKKNIINDLEKRLSKIKEEINSIEDDEGLIKELEDEASDIETEIDELVERDEAGNINWDIEEKKEYNSKVQSKIDEEKEKLEITIQFELESLEEKESQLLVRLEKLLYEEDENDKQANIDELSPFVFQRLNKLLDIYHKRITHLPAFRAEQRRIFALSELEDNYQEAIRRFWDLEVVESDKKKQDDKEKRKTFIKEQFEKFEIPYDYLKIEDAEDSGDTFRVWLTKGDEKRNLADMGFGVSQLMPTILVCATAKEGEIISIEEAETNLHPKFQSILAEMFVEVSKRKVQVILETHSEYLIRKMQELVKNETINYTNSLIYYFTKQEQELKPNENRFELIDFKEGGKIDYWKFGEGFFDTDYELEFGLLNLQAKELFRSLKNDLDKLSDEEKQKIIDDRIEHYTNIQDLSKWKTGLETDIPNFRKLGDKTKHYLASAKFFLGIFDKSKEQKASNNKIDFAPVIMQYGKAVEAELQTLSSELYPTYNFSLQNIQKQFERTVSPQNEPLDLTLFDGKLNNFNELLNEIKNTSNNIDLTKLCVLEVTRRNEPENNTLLGFIRSYRNASSHPNQNNEEGIWDYQTASNYEYYVLEFFKLWCINLK